MTWTWRTVDCRPHEYRPAPTKRLPHRSRCNYCGDYSDTRAEGASVVSLRPCPANGDDEATGEIMGQRVRIWRSRTPAVGEVTALVETPEAVYTWTAGRENDRKDRSFLLGFAVHAALALRDGWVPSGAAPAPKEPSGEVVRVDFVARRREP